MASPFLRYIYSLLLNLHPPAFQRQFKKDMLWIFDEASAERRGAHLFADALLSLGRQWILRSFLPRFIVAEVALAPISSVPFGSFAWERIGLPDPPLPVPRLMQGGVASFVFIGFLSVLAVGTGNAAHAYRLAHGQRQISAPRNRPQHQYRPQTRYGLRAATEQVPENARSSTQAASSSQTLASSSASTNQMTGSQAGQPVFATYGTGQQPQPSASESPSLDYATPDDSMAKRMAMLSGLPEANSAVRLLTSQYDNARTGANLNETVLTPENVNAKQFGKLFAFQVDGDVYAQPLYLPDVEIPGKGKHKVLYVATENDSVYAFDAAGASTEPLWHVNLAGAENGGKPLAERDVRCFFIAPEIGITSTPVIDLPSGTMYVLARTKESKSMMSSDEFKQRLHALAVTTGAEKFGGPIEIKATFSGARGQVSFDSLHENPRAALLLANDSIYLTWASSCDEGPYYGWLMAYDKNTLAQKSVFNTAPDKAFSGIWQGDAGPAADKDGNVFVVTGNGDFDANANGHDYGDSVLRLRSDSGGFSLADYFTPSNQARLNERDNDLGSSGPVLLPDQPGPHPHVLLTAGKEGKIYVIDRDHMGKFQPGNDPHAVQTISASHGAFGAMAYWNQNVYFIGSEARLQDFSVDHGELKLKAAGDSKFLDSGATPSVSANGSKNGVVWAASSKNWNEQAGRNAILYAYDASDIHHELYTSEQNSARDRAGIALRFVIPTVVNGKVYLGTKNEVAVYGLLPQH